MGKDEAYEYIIRKIEKRNQVLKAQAQQRQQKRDALKRQGIENSLYGVRRTL